jgi:photosystem II stability/assembly factor-like uncharacterized protein
MPHVDQMSGPSEPQSNSSWVSIGPWGGNARAVVASPIDPSIILCGVASERGLYRSTDGGADWVSVPDIQPPRCCVHNDVYDIEFDPRGNVYAGTSMGLWKSTDSGASWSELDLGIGLQKTVVEITIDPTDSDHVWIGISHALGAQTTLVMQSRDGGVTWTSATPPLTSLMTCWGIAVSPADSDNVYTGFGGFPGGGQVWVSDDAGATWMDRSPQFPNGPIYDIIHDGTRVLLCGGQPYRDEFVGVYASYDAGASWEALHGVDWPSLSINDLELDPNDQNTILVASTGGGGLSEHQRRRHVELRHWADRCVERQQCALRTEQLHHGLPWRQHGRSADQHQWRYQLRNEGQWSG